MSMEVDSTDENTDRWGKSSPHSSNNSNASQSISPSPPTTKKKKKSKHSKKKKKRKHSKSKSKKKKSNTSKHNRWRPEKTSDNNTPKKITISFKNHKPKSSHSPSPKPSTKDTKSSHSRSKSPSHSVSNSAHSHSKSSSRSHSNSQSRSRSRSRSRSKSNSHRRYRRKRTNDSRDRDRDRHTHRDRRHYERERDRKYSHFTDSPPPRCYRDAMERKKNPFRKEKRINHKVIAALNEIKQKHKNDNKHPLDLKQQELNRTVASKKDKAMIFAAASGYFESEILKSLQFEKNISLALKALSVNNKEFDIAQLFKQFSNYSVKLIWKDYSIKQEIGINKSELLTFRDLYSIRSYRKELNHCDKLWKFIFYDQRHLFWSMAIYYALIKTTLVPEWDKMFEQEYYLINKYGKFDYINKDCQGIEDRKNERKLKKEKKRMRRNHNDNDSDIEHDSA